MGFEDMSMCYNTSCGLDDKEENKECTKHNPLIEKPDWDVVCHASAWDFDTSKEDYRYVNVGYPLCFIYIILSCVLRVLNLSLCIFIE